MMILTAYTHYLFWLFALLTVYTYFLYPALIGVAAYFSLREKVVKKEHKPFISVVIPAYNEEKAIGKKLENLLHSRYPKEKMEIVVVSDYSGDKTDEIVRSFSNRGVKLHRLKKRGGKIAGYISVLPEL